MISYHPPSDPIPTSRCCRGLSRGGSVGASSWQARSGLHQLETLIVVVLVDQTQKIYGNLYFTHYQSNTSLNIALRSQLTQPPCAHIRTVTLQQLKRRSMLRSLLSKTFDLAHKIFVTVCRNQKWICKCRLVIDQMV